MLQNESLIEIVIEYDGFIAGRELAEIIELVDDALWTEMEDYYLPPPFRYRYARVRDEPPPLFCITEVRPGSMVLLGAIGGAAAMYCYRRFRKGLRRSRVGDEIEHLGQIVGDRLGSIVERLNRWLEDYSEDAKRQESRIKRVHARKRGYQSDERKG